MVFTQDHFLTQLLIFQHTEKRQKLQVVFKKLNPMATQTHKKGLVLLSSYILTKAKIKRISNIIIREISKMKNKKNLKAL